MLCVYMCGEKRMLFYDYYCFMMNVVCFIFYDLALIWLVGCVVKDYFSMVLHRSRLLLNCFYYYNYYYYLNKFYMLTWFCTISCIILQKKRVGDFLRFWILAF